MTEILLVRHGQTDWNLEGRIQGHSDIPLNSTGISQSEVLAESIKHDPFDAVFSSDLSRAMQTAQIISARLRVPLYCDSRLREVNHGAWEGMLIKVVRDTHQDAYAAFRNDQPGACPPGGETLQEAILRMETAVARAAASYPEGRIVLVSHGLSLALLRCRLNDAPLSLSHQYGLDNCPGEMIHWQTRR